MRQAVGPQLESLPERIGAVRLLRSPVYCCKVREILEVEHELERVLMLVPA